MCITWNCTDNMWKCNDNKRCILHSLLCDGKMECLDSSDEENCIHYKCLDNARKCANKMQCVHENSICDGEIDCIDGSDELCKASCLKSPLNNNTIIRRCTEDSRVCVPVERYCDRLPDCPLGSDEAALGCSCDDWNLYSCPIQGTDLCIYAEWITSKRLGIVEIFCKSINPSAQTSSILHLVFFHLSKG